MKIDKALKKQSRNKKIFYGLMVFLSIFLPLLTYLSYISSGIILIFLFIIEILILIELILMSNYYKLDFKYTNDKLKVKSGIFNKENKIFCDNVAMVHTNKEYEEMEIIIIIKLDCKTNKFNSITRRFIKKYKEIQSQYIKLKDKNPDSIFYFHIIKEGALKKYILLDTIYKNCVNAIYTDSAIQDIKIARGENEI